jgi:hypothetical protein
MRAAMAAAVAGTAAPTGKDEAAMEPSLAHV